MRIPEEQLRRIIREEILEEDVRRRGDKWCAYVDDKLTKAEKEANPSRHKGKKVGAVQRTPSGKIRMKARGCYPSKKRANNTMAAAMMESSHREIMDQILEDLAGLDEQVSIPYSGEKSAQGLSTTNQLKYAAARGVLGATPAGAQGVATGKVQVTPTAGEATKNAWNSSIMDWTMTAVGAIADLIPGPGTVLSITIAQVQLVKFAVAQNWLGCASAVLAMFPGVGDAIGIIGRLLQKGTNVSVPIAEAAVRAVGSVADDALQDQVITVANAITDPASRKMVTDNIPKIIAAKNKFVTDLKRSIATPAPSAA